MHINRQLTKKKREQYCPPHFLSYPFPPCRTIYLPTYALLESKKVAGQPMAVVPFQSEKTPGKRERAGGGDEGMVGGLVTALPSWREKKTKERKIK